MFQSPPPPIKLSQHDPHLGIIAKEALKIKSFFKKSLIFSSCYFCAFFREKYTTYCSSLGSIRRYFIGLRKGGKEEAA